MQYKTILLTPTPFQIVIQPTYIEILGLPACTIEIFLRMYKLFCKLIFLVIIFLEYLSLVYKYKLGKKKTHLQEHLLHPQEKLVGLLNRLCSM